MPAAGYIAALNGIIGNCRAMLAVRGAAAKNLTGSPRRSTSTLLRIATAQAAYWAKNTTAYTALTTAVPTKPVVKATAAKARRAGA